MQDAYVYDGLRTPIGRHAGGLAPVRPDDLLGGVIKELVGRNPFKPGDYEDAVVGCTNQAGEDARNVARHAALLAGLPTDIGGLTVNRLCGSGLAAVVDAGRAASTGQGALFVAGGVESMSRAPFVMAKSESAFSRDFKMFDSTIGARFPNPRIAKGFGQDTMPETADNVAHDHQIGRACLAGEIRPRQGGWLLRQGAHAGECAGSQEGQRNGGGARRAPAPQHDDGPALRAQAALRQWCRHRRQRVGHQ
jgi:acetyl-CoA C-acetyltransferase